MNNVRQLHTLHPERRATLKQFSADQARFWMEQMVKPEGGAAALHIAITGEHQVETKLCAVEPEHAAILLTELDSVRAKLCKFLAEQAPELLGRASAPADQPDNVVVLRQ